MTQDMINQLWQALNEAETAYDYSIIFNYSISKGVVESERKDT